MNGTATPLRTDTVQIPRIDVDPDTTVEFRPPWLKPPTTTLYRTPRRRLSNRIDQVRDSGPVRHLWAATRSAFWPCSIGAGVILALLLIAHLQDLTPTTGIR